MSLAPDLPPGKGRAAVPLHSQNGHATAAGTKGVAVEWRTYASALAAWAEKHLVNRHDAWGGYYFKAGVCEQTTCKAEDIRRGKLRGPLTPKLLAGHFGATGTSQIIGLHSTARDDEGSWCRWLGVDIDCHTDEDNPDANLRAALAWYDRATSLGFSPLLYDSNGAGGYHLVLLFDGKVPSEKVFAFGRWLTRDWEALGFAKEPETFPKQPEIPPGGFGNWMRLPGRHHKREHYHRVWDDSVWLEGKAAIKRIIETRGTSADCIPEEARPNPNAPVDYGRTVHLGDRKKRDRAEDGTVDAGTDFNDRGTWEAVILPYGWVLDHYDSDGVGYWRRPGKHSGTSATTNHNGTNTLYVFTNNAPPFQQSGSYSLFGAYAALNHGGSFTDATKDLSLQGYGTFATWVVRDGEVLKDVRPNPCPKGVKIAKPGEPPPPELLRGSRGGATPPGGGGFTVTPAGPSPGEQRVEVEISTERHLVLDETLAALPRDPHLFSRGDVLVKITNHAAETMELGGGVELRNTAGSTRVVVMGEAGLSCRLTRIIDFYQWFKNRNNEMTTKSVHPPPWLVKAVLEHADYRGVRKLRGIAEVPFPRPDGSLVTTPGYDEATGVYYTPTVDVGLIPDRPTQADARAAGQTLLRLVKQFPFATDNDRAVWLAGLLTVIGRPAIAGPVPGIALNGNRAGTGKGKLIDTQAVIATGRPVPTTSYPHDEDETRKLKTALALAATPIVHLDNLDEGRSYGGGVLDSALTTLVVNERILGQSKSTGPIEIRCCWFLSGNNLSPTKDAYRRWLVCNLVTDLERPEEREDLEVPDLLAHVRERRGELVRAALIILRAHAVAGRPSGWKSKLGSFEEWDEVVRGAVWYATGWDCNETRKRAAEESPDRLNRLALLEAWAAIPDGGHDGRGLTSEQAYRLATTSDSEKAVDLADAFARFGRDNKPPSTKVIGNTIRGMEGRNICGRAFQKCGNRKHAALWRVVNLSTDAPEHQIGRHEGRGKGESGESEESDSSLPTRELHIDYDVMAHTGNGNRIWNGGGADSPDSPDSPEAERQVFDL